MSKSSKNRTNVKVYWPPLFPGGRPQLFCSKLLARFTIHRLAKCGWVLFADLHLRSLEWSRMQNLRRVGKNGGRVWSRLWTKVHDILGQCRRHLVVVKALDRLSLSCCVPKAVTVALKLRSCPKKVVLGPRFVGGRDIPDFGHAVSNYTYFRPCGRIWFSSVQPPRRLADEKKKERRKKETLVKYKSADILCRAA